MTAVVGVISVGLLTIVVRHFTKAPEPPSLALAEPVEVVRVDDSIDLFRTIDETALPLGVQRIAEDVGREPRVSHYIQLAPQPGESLDAALTRIEPWLGALRLPPGTRLVWEPVESSMQPVGSPVTQGWRSYLVQNKAFLGGSDIQGAALVESEQWSLANHDFSSDDEPPTEERWSVEIRLRAHATDRWKQAIRDILRQRVAILVGGHVAAAPVIYAAALNEQNVVIAMGVGLNREESRIAAKRLLSRLTGEQ
jgi:hypothetical protein